jgi:hypothetical protein
MSLWDGVTASNDNVIILAATNKPNDIGKIGTKQF